MSFIIQDGDCYVSRTCHCGPFYGKIRIVVDDRDNARRWTRRRDAERFVKTLIFRIKTYKHENEFADLTDWRVVEIKE